MKNIALIILIGMLSSTLFAQYPLTEIRDIQFISDQDLANGVVESSLLGDTIQVEGIVMFDPCTYQLSSSQSRIGTFIQKAGGGAWSGVHILVSPGDIPNYSGDVYDLERDILFLDNFQVGNKVRCTGIVTAFAGNTQVALLPVASSIQSIGNTLPAPTTLRIDSFMLSDGAGNDLPQYESGERWEGIYVEIQNVFATDISNGSGGSNVGRVYWSLQQGINKMRIRDVSGDISNRISDIYCDTTQSATPTPFPTPDPAFHSFIRGTIVEYQTGGNNVFAIAPLSLNDIGPVVAAPPVILDVELSNTSPSSTSTVTVSAEITDDTSVVSATLYYSVGLGNTTWTSLGMFNTSGDTYEATIPATNQDSVFVNYWIRAKDNGALSSDFPDSNATNSFYFVYDGTIETIRLIQETPRTNGFSIWDGRKSVSMDIDAIVTSSPQPYDLGLLTVQDGNGPWSGILIEVGSSAGTEDLVRGDMINLSSADISELFGATHLTNANFTLLSQGNPIPAAVMGLNEDSLRTRALSVAEAYEAMFIGYANTTVIGLNADGPSSDFGEFEINLIDTADNGLRVDDIGLPFGFNQDSVTVGQKLNYIYGILYWSFGNYKLLPRNLADIDGFSTEYPKAITSFEFAGLSPVVTGSINPVSGEISVQVPAGTDLSTLVPSIAHTGIMIDPASDVAQDFSSSVTYTVTAPIDSSTKAYVVTVEVVSGIYNNPDMDNIELFPNPATDILYLNVNSKRAESANINLISVAGKKVLSIEREMKTGNNNLSLNLNELPEGIYFVEIKTATQSFFSKVQVY